MSEHLVPRIAHLPQWGPKMIQGSPESLSTSRTSQLGARGKRRGFSPGAAAPHSQSARVYTDRFENPIFFNFSEFIQAELKSQKCEFNRLNSIWQKRPNPISVPKRVVVTMLSSGGRSQFVRQKNLSSTGWTQICKDFLCASCWTQIFEKN